METDGDGSGGIFPSRQGVRTDFCPSKFISDDGGATELF
jgi:hypothetical protein